MVPRYNKYTIERVFIIMNWKLLINIGSYYRLNDDVLKRMHIEPVEKIDNHDEIWSFVVLDRHKELQESLRYLVSNYGRVYDLETESLLVQTRLSKSSTGYYYQAVHLVAPDDKHGRLAMYLCHRLVALAFIPQIKDKPFVNHIDACPEHNYAWNLEWCNASENFWHAHSMGLIHQEKGENRSNAMWTDYEINLICMMMQEGHKATYIYHALGDIIKDEKVTYERVRTLVKHIKHRTHWIHISKNYNIDFSKFNYSKEQASVRSAQLRNQNKSMNLNDPEELKLP